MATQLQFEIIFSNANGVPATFSYGHDELVKLDKLLTTIIISLSLIKCIVVADGLTAGGVPIFSMTLTAADGREFNNRFYEAARGTKSSPSTDDFFFADNIKDMDLVRDQVLVVWKVWPTLTHLHFEQSTI